MTWALPAGERAPQGGPLEEQDGLGVVDAAVAHLGQRLGEPEPEALISRLPGLTHLSDRSGQRLRDAFWQAYLLREDDAVINPEPELDVDRVAGKLMDELLGRLQRLAIPMDPEALTAALTAGVADERVPGWIKDALRRGGHAAR